MGGHMGPPLQNNQNVKNRSKPALIGEEEPGDGDSSGASGGRSEVIRDSDEVAPYNTGRKEYGIIWETKGKRGGGHAR